MDFKSSFQEMKMIAKKNVHILIFLYLLIFLQACSSSRNRPVNQKQTPPQTQPTQVEEMTPELPVHWDSVFIKEPVFNGLIHVVESGKQHDESISVLRSTVNLENTVIRSKGVALKVQQSILRGGSY